MKYLDVSQPATRNHKVPQLQNYCFPVIKKKHRRLNQISDKSEEKTLQALDVIFFETQESKILLQNKAYT